MRVRAKAPRRLPAKAQGIQTILDIILQIVNVITALANLLGFPIPFFDTDNGD